ncbi:MAG: Ig-like domain-containing protein [Tannerellaceae bacterium]|nr:Ig-like domain-containing protein [Tannerellaceae bacterium]
MKKSFLIFLAGIFLIGSCSNKEREEVTGISLDRSELSLVYGETATLTATVLPHNADNKTVSWSSTVPAIALVDNRGGVTAIGVGSTVISAVTEDGGKKATCAVTVTSADVSVTGISLNKSELSLFVGETETLKAIVTPDNATDKTVSWASDNPTVATVNASTGEITAKSAGEAKISAIANDGGKSAACNVTVVEVKNENELRVMSFNIWGGGKSIDRTIAAIRESGADIAGIQEEANNSASRIANALGWTSFHTYTTLLGKGCSIVSKYPIVAVSASKIGVKLQIGYGKYVWMFNQHLNHCPYEPYMLNGIEYCGGGTLNTEEEAIASAWGARKGDVELTISEIQEAQKEQIPIFLTGDFNEPSCLDWTERATAAGLCKIPVAWPATKKLQEQTGMKDSYRTVYPDEVAKPGYTWTPIPATREVLDRIDFVFFWGDKLQVVKSEIVGEKKPESDIVIQSFPSDHRAVVSTFHLE